MWFISFHVVPHWKWRMNATSRTWSWEINSNIQRYTVTRLMWFSLVLLHSLCILKSILLGFLKSDCLPFMAEQELQHMHYCLPLSGSCWKVRVECQCLCLHCSCPFLPLRPAAVFWQPVVFVSVRGIKQSLPVHRASLGLTRWMFTFKYSCCIIKDYRFGCLLLPIALKGEEGVGSCLCWLWWQIGELRILQSLQNAVRLCVCH